MMNVAEDKLDKAARHILCNIPELGKFTIEEIKDFLRLRAQEIINTIH